jgi:hypothetical protein
MNQLASCAIVLIALGVAGSALAQYPVRTYERYCLESLGRDGPDGLLCRFATLEQCYASRNGPGDRCMLNPQLGALRR